MAPVGTCLKTRPKKPFVARKSFTAANTHITRGGEDVARGVARTRMDGTAQPGEGHPNTEPRAMLAGFRRSFLGQPTRRCDEGAAS